MYIFCLYRKITRIWAAPDERRIFKMGSELVGLNFIAQRAIEEKIFSARDNTPTYRRNTMATVSITSNEGALESASAVLEVTATNPEYNQPALRIKQAGKSGGAASIRIDDPNPDIELIETDQVAPAGKYEIAVQSDKLQINGRNASDTGFETIVVFQRRAAGGNIGFGTTSQFGARQGVIAIVNASVAPSVNPAGGGILFVEDGALKYRGSNGAITTIAPA
jgi:hypothetical protein